MDKFYLKKLIDFRGNRYVLTKACNEYAKKVRNLFPDDYEKIKNKDSILALSHMLKDDISYTLEKPEFEEDDLAKESILFDSKLSQKTDDRDDGEEVLKKTDNNNDSE